MPTRWQWEYVCRAGNATFAEIEIRNASNVSATGVTRNSTEEEGTSHVDRYPANAWGFYGMRGNVWECCKDWKALSISRGDTVIGPGEIDDTASTVRKMRLMGGGWHHNSSYSVPYRYMSSGDSWNAAETDANGYGVRYILPIK